MTAPLSPQAERLLAVLPARDPITLRHAAHRAYLPGDVAPAALREIKALGLARKWSQWNDRTPEPEVADASVEVPKSPKPHTTSLIALTAQGREAQQELPLHKPATTGPRREPGTTIHNRSAA